MFTNTTDSTIKTAIDTLYTSNMTDYIKYLEEIEHEFGVRQSVSLKAGTEVSSGDGSTSSPLKFN